MNLTKYQKSKLKNIEILIKKVKLCNEKENVLSCLEQISNIATILYDSIDNDDEIYDAIYLRGNWKERDKK